MRYVVSVAGREIVVEVAGDRVLVDGEPVEADLRALVDGGAQHLTLDGRSHELVVVTGEEPGARRVVVDGVAVDLEILDERTRRLRRAAAPAAHAAGPRPIRAPMPGLVVRVEVEPGESVKSGQGVVIVEAMKMENELKAEAPGVVSAIRVSAGQAVERGTVLVEFASP